MNHVGPNAPQTKTQTKPSSHNNYSFMKKIDMLPAGPDWTCEVVKAAGDHIDEDGTPMEEELELW